MNTTTNERQIPCPDCGETMYKIGGTGKMIEIMEPTYADKPGLKIAGIVEQVIYQCPKCKRIILNT